MKSFGFIVNPLTIRQMKNFWPISKTLPDFIIGQILKISPFFKVIPIKKIESAKRTQITGYLLLCPPLPQGTSNEQIIDKLVAAAGIAQGLGVKLLGLGGIGALVADKENRIGKSVKIPVTNGSALTAWSIFEAIYRLAKSKRIDLKKSCLAIIGAVNSIGSLCTKKFSDYVSRIIPISAGQDVKGALKDADIVINADYTLDNEFETKDLNPNSILCNVVLPGCPTSKHTSIENISVIDAGLIKLPHAENSALNIGLPKGIVFASMAETMLLTLEGKFISYSSGDNINPDKLEEIADISVRHGFEVWVPEAPLF